MAKKKRRKASKAKKKTKPTRKKKPVRRWAKRAKGPIARAYDTVSGTIKDTGKLRNKMERAGTDETE